MSRATHNIAIDPRCPFCETEGAAFCFSAQSISGSTHDYFSCPNCQSLYLWPQPAPDHLKENYDTSYYGEKSEKFLFPGVEKAIDVFRSGRARRIARLTGYKGEVLDIGCGSGRFLHILGKKGDYTLLGSELPGPAASRASRFPEIRLSQSSEFHPEAQPASLDAITMFHVIEHLDKPAEMLRRIFASLKPGGYFYVSFPNVHGWQGRHFRGDWLHLDPPRHLVLFHPDRFEAYVLQMGFQRIHRSGRSIEQNPFGMVQSILNRLLNHRDLLFESLKGNKAYARRSSPLSLLLQKCFFIISFPVFVLTDMLMAAGRRNATVTYIFRKTDSSNNI
ncbi:MAG: class I SAM-dependent methyltransferase [Bacteroidales bacterium]|nr:class I SAM-dependent methyltransferase [Bacteroidales bacterium]